MSFLLPSNEVELLKESGAEEATDLEQGHFFMLSLDMLWIVDKNGSFLRLNPATKTTLGFDPEELVGKSFRDYLHPDDVKLSRLAMDQLLTGVPMRGHINRFRCHDGSYRSIQWSVTPYGEHFYGVGRDVTKQIQPEEKTNGSQRLWQATLDALTTHIAILDEEGRILAQNTAWQQLHEDKEEAPYSCNTGANYIQFCEAAGDHWSEDAQSLAKGIRLVLSGDQQSFQFEYSCHSSQQQRWFNASITRFEEDESVRVVVAQENITSLKVRENLIRTREANLAVAQHIAHLGSWELDLSGSGDQAMLWSDEIYRILGYKPAQLEPSQEDFFKVVHPDDREKVRRVMEEALHEEKPYTVEHRLIWSDGHERIVKAQSEIIYDERTNKPLKMVGIAQDITEQKQTEAQLNFQKTLLEAQTEASLDGILIVSAEGKILSYNQRFLQMWKVPDELLTNDDDEVLLQANLAKVINPEKFLERVKHLYDHQSEQSHEEIALQGGSIFDRYSAPIINAEGAYLGRVWYFRDITERKQSERALHISNERFEILSRATNDAVWDWNLLTNNLWWNEGFENLFGYKRRSIETDLGSWESRLHPDDKERVIQGLSSMVENGQQTWSDEYRFLRANGSYAEILDRGFIILDENGLSIRMVGSMQDVTHRKQVERALSESEEHLRQILANVPGMIYQFASYPDGYIDWPFVGRGCRDIFEIEPETLRGNPTWPFGKIHPDDLEGFDKSVLLSTEMLLPTDWVGRLNMPSGETKWIHIISRPHLLPDGGTLWNGLIMDVTDRKREEEENARLQAQVEQQREWANNIIASVPGIVWESWIISDGSSPRTDFVSDYVATMTGYSVEEWLATPSFWNTIIHPDDRETAIREGQEFFESGKGGTSQYRWIARDGRIVWCEVRMVVISDETGKPIGLRGVTIDITERKETEAALQQAHDELERRVEERTAEIQKANELLRVEVIERVMAMDALRLSAEALREAQQRLQIVMDHIPQAIFWKDRNFRYVGCNCRFAANVGLSSPQEVRGKTDFDIVAFENADAFRAEDQQIMQSDTPKLNAEASFTAADGSVSWLRINKIPLHDKEGSVVGILCSYEDVTEQKQTEAIIHAARQEADAANLAKSEFLSRMSHELRTPLNAILGFGQILEKQELTPLSRESVNYILKGGQHLLDLVNEVLDITRVETGHLDLCIEPIAFESVVSEACALMRQLAAERNIRINEISHGTEQTHILADRQRIKQVLINLLANAIKYNRDGGSIEIAFTNRKDGWATISIKDTGVGIPPEGIPKLFTPFERLGASDSQIEGTGLGLALSKRLMKAMDGRLDVESTLGFGTTFIISLPIAIFSAENVPIHQNPPVQIKEIGKAALTYSVLCIEDSISNLRLVEMSLQRRPEITLITAMNGSDGLTLGRQHEPDLILLDLNLPDMHGSEVLTRLQQSAITRDIPVIIISADATKDQITRLLAAGVSAYLTKPLHIGQLLQAIDEFLPNKRNAT
jgi:PAS domain S-box-containing protein